MTENLNSFFEVYGLRTRFEPEPWQGISELGTLDSVLTDLEKRLDIQPAEPTAAADTEEPAADLEVKDAD